MSTTFETSVIRLDASDNVVIARCDLAAGEPMPGEAAVTREAITAGHKIAARGLKAGEAIVKAGTIIGYATCDLKPGDRIHSRNVEAAPAAVIPSSSVQVRSVQLLAPGHRATFRGYRRENGSVGTRNYIGVFVMVNCAATTARKIAEAFDEAALAAYPNVDGVVPFIHELGCGMEMTGEPMDLLRRTISGVARNPNIGGAVVLALGCERNNIYGFLEQEKLAVGPRLKTLVMQERGGTAITIAEGIAAVKEMLPLVNAIERKAVSAEHLTVGLQSSGADAFAELSAHPALGVATDLLVANGATVIVSGTSDLNGVESALAGRAASPEVAHELGQRVTWWKQYSEGHETATNGRLGRAAVSGGVATITERALSASKRWGTSPLKAVYRYAQPVTANGLVFMDTPVGEAVSVTGQMAGGANVICLVTGRASGFGSVPAPTVKLATHSALFRRFSDDLDLDCGPVLEGKLGVDEMGHEIFESLLRVASGAKTRGEELGVGENEFVPWPIGVFS